MKYYLWVDAKDRPVSQALAYDDETERMAEEERPPAGETGPEAGETRITDLHVWRVGKGASSCALSIVTHDTELTATEVRERLASALIRIDPPAAHRIDPVS